MLLHRSVCPDTFRFRLRSVVESCVGKTALQMTFRIIIGLRLSCYLAAFLLGPCLIAAEVESPVLENPRVGDKACYKCHQEKSDSSRQTAHAQTSSWPSRATIRGKFDPGSNVLQTSNPNLRYVMKENEKSFTQTAWFKLPPATMLDRTEIFGLVIGAGRKGQTYLYWDDDRLFQLPVSYWTEVDCWINSPGYPDGTPHFERPTPPRCLECHATSFEWRPPTENRYDKESLVLGLSCEKCHGPGGQHVALYESASPAELRRTETAIINPAKLSRDRRIDSCALCHGGAGESLTPPLSFKPGDVLAGHVALPVLNPAAHLDVHASQVQLLKLSRCFQNSPTMSCSTCHDVHKPQRDAASFVAQCMTCHQVEQCRLFGKLGGTIARGCVECHMPEEKTDQIVFNANGKIIQPQVRNHRIAIYPTTVAP